MSAKRNVVAVVHERSARLTRATICSRGRRRSESDSEQIRWCQSRPRSRKHWLICGPMRLTLWSHLGAQGDQDCVVRVCVFETCSILWVITCYRIRFPKYQSPMQQARWQAWCDRLLWHYRQSNEHSMHSGQAARAQIPDARCFLGRYWLDIHKLSRL